jgi:hypothetical protein
MNARNEKPVPPWEQEQAAAALAELKRSEEAEKIEQKALKVADSELLIQAIGTKSGNQAALKDVDSELLIQQIDRMIAEKRADLARMQRIPQAPLHLGRDKGARGVTLNELGKPIAIGILLLAIVAMGLALRWMAGKISESIPEVPPAESEQLAAPAE